MSDVAFLKIEDSSIALYKYVISQIKLSNSSEVKTWLVKEEDDCSEEKTANS